MNNRRCLLLYHCQMHLHCLRILLTIPLDCNIIHCLFQRHSVFFLLAYISLQSCGKLFVFLCPVKGLRIRLRPPENFQMFIFIYIYIYLQLYFYLQLFTVPYLHLIVYTNLHTNLIYTNLHTNLIYTCLFILMFYLYYYMNLIELLKYGDVETTTKFSRLKSISSIENNYYFTLQ